MYSDDGFSLALVLVLTGLLLCGCAATLDHVARNLPRERHPGGCYTIHEPFKEPVEKCSK